MAYCGAMTMDGKETIFLFTIKLYGVCVVGKNEMDRKTRGGGRLSYNCMDGI